MLPAELQHIFYPTQQPQIPALQGGDVDIVNLIVPQGAEGVLNNPDYKLWVTKSSQHRELSMRCDKAPWDNKLVRQAMALSLNRPEIAQALFKGYAQLGNDNPFAPIFRSTNTTVPQRAQDIDQGQAAAVAGRSPQRLHDRPLHRGLPGDDATTLRSSSRRRRRSASTSTCTSTTRPPTTRTTGCRASMSLVDYGHRGVPNVVLTATLRRTARGTPPTSRTPQYDGLVKQYVAALDLSTQKQIAGQIETLLLDETP